MQDYIGVKRIKAIPTTQREYYIYRRWELPDDRNGDDAGYLVEYVDSPNSNHENHSGYISWSPKGVFDAAYRPVAGLSFGLAIEAAKRGEKIARAGWNGKNMFVAYMSGLKLPPYNSQIPGTKVDDRTAKHIGKDTPLDSQPYLAMHTAQQKWQTGWLASQSDMLTDDWYIV